MGAWSAGILGDDTALEVFDNLLAAPDPRPMMATAFGEALKAGCVDYDAGQWVLVSAAVIAHVAAGVELDDLGSMDNMEEDSGNVEVWIDGLRRLDFSGLRAAAAQACDKVIHGDSDLRELWAENEELFPQWEAQGNRLVRALSMPRGK